jgi:hypothetical protein
MINNTLIINSDMENHGHIHPLYLHRQNPVPSTTTVKLPGKADKQDLQKAFWGFHCTNEFHPLQAHKGLMQHLDLFNGTIYTFNYFLISNIGMMCLRWIEVKSDRLAWKMRIISCKTA